MKLLNIVILILFASLSYAQSSEEERQILLSPLADDFILGNKSAPVTIIEYSSLSCPSCAFFHDAIFDDIKANYIDTGKVRFIHRNYPLNEAAMRAAIVPICAGKNKYFIFLKSLFETQSSWMNNKSALQSIAALGGMPKQQLAKCMADKTIENQLLQSRLDAHNILEINATPTFFINGEKISGVPGKENIYKIIDQKLADAKK